MSEILVVKLGGTTIADQTQVLAEVAAVARRRPVVLVHGGGKRITEWLERLGVPSQVRGRPARHRRRQSLEVAAAVLRGVVNSELVAGPARPRRRCRRAVGRRRRPARSPSASPSSGLVARVVGLRRDLLDAILVGGQVPVVAPLARDADGIVCNVNADDAAAGIAAGLGARQLVLLTDVDGVRDADGHRLDALTVGEAETPDRDRASSPAAWCPRSGPRSGRSAGTAPRRSSPTRPRPRRSTARLDDPTFGTRITASRPAARGRRRERGVDAPSNGHDFKRAAPAGDPRARQRAADRQPARGRRCARRAGLRGHPGDRLARHRRARPGQGARRRRPRLRHAGSVVAPSIGTAAVGRAAASGSSPTSRSRIGRSGLILVLTGTPGTASVIAQAIDESTLHEQEGTLAGDNTLLVLFADELAPRALARPLPGHPGTLRRFKHPVNKVVLAYSGGLDTSVAVAWLREQFGVEVVTLTVDLGGGSLRPGVEARAMSAGASRAYVVDARERFVTDFVWPHLQANALYQGAYPLATALARPLIAQLLVEVAKREGADAVAHGCTGKGNDQVRFDVATHALDPGLEVIAPMRVGMGLTRDQEIDYAAERGIEIPITKASPYSIDVNLWGRSCETGVLEDPWVTPPADAYEWTVAAARRARRRSRSLIDFEGGIPVALDGERLAPVELVERVHDAGRRARRRPDRPRRGPPGRHQEPRDLRDAGGDDPARRAPRARGADAVARHAPVQPVRRRRAGAPDLRRPVVQRAVARPARVRRVVAAGRLGRGPGPAGSRLGGRRRAALADVAVRQEPRHVRRGRRVRPRVGGRVHRDLRAAAAGRGGPPRRRRQAPRRGLDVDRSAARGPADAVTDPEPAGV